VWRSSWYLYAHVSGGTTSLSSPRIIATRHRHIRQVLAHRLGARAEKHPRAELPGKAVLGLADRPLRAALPATRGRTCGPGHRRESSPRAHRHAAPRLRLAPTASPPTLPAIRPGRASSIRPALVGTKQEEQPYSLMSRCILLSCGCLSSRGCTFSCGTLSGFGGGTLLLRASSMALRSVPTLALPSPAGSSSCARRRPPRTPPCAAARRPLSRRGEAPPRAARGSPSRPPTDRDGFRRVWRSSAQSREPLRRLRTTRRATRSFFSRPQIRRKNQLVEGLVLSGFELVRLNRAVLEPAAESRSRSESAP
jgi:hypothetical protein